MSRFGVKALLKYHMFPQRSYLILASQSNYYHPFRYHINMQNTSMTVTFIGDTRYEACKSIETNSITVLFGSGGICFYHNNQQIMSNVDEFVIEVYKNGNFYRVFKRRSKFNMLPMIKDLQHRIEVLEAVSVYDLYRQSITWLLEFATR